VCGETLSLSPISRNDRYVGRYGSKRNSAAARQALPGAVEGASSTLLVSSISVIWPYGGSLSFHGIHFCRRRASNVPPVATLRTSGWVG
jgi:hypothetical protein